MTDGSRAVSTNKEGPPWRNQLRGGSFFFVRRNGSLYNYLYIFIICDSAEKSSRPAKKRPCLVIGGGALLIADYFDWVDKFRLVADVGHQGNVTSTLDGHGQGALMESAGAGHTAGDDLCTLRNVLTQTGHVLVIDGVDAIDTEAANLLAAAADGARGARAFGSFKSHCLLPPVGFLRFTPVRDQNGRSSLSSMTAKSSAFPAE